MIGSSIKIDDRELRKFNRSLQDLKRSQITAIERQVINDEAFAVRTVAMKETIPKEFHNRSTWVASSILVDKAKGSNLAKMYSEVGAKKRWKRNPAKDFIGMKQQEFGDTIRGPGIETLYSRSGNLFSGRVKPSFRFDRMGNVVDESEFPGGNNRFIVMLRVLERRNYKGYFRIRKTRAGKLKKGIYKFKGAGSKFRDGKKHKQIMMVMDTSKGSARLKKKKWLNGANKKAINNNTVGEFYRKAFIKYTKKRISK